jgi:hypothetical protein
MENIYSDITEQAPGSNPVEEIAEGEDEYHSNDTTEIPPLGRSNAELRNIDITGATRTKPLLKSFQFKCRSSTNFFSEYLTNVCNTK